MAIFKIVLVLVFLFSYVQCEKSNFLKIYEEIATDLVSERLHGMID